MAETLLLLGSSAKSRDFLMHLVQAIEPQKPGQLMLWASRSRSIPPRLDCSKLSDIEDSISHSVARDVMEAIEESLLVREPGSSKPSRLSKFEKALEQIQENPNSSSWNSYHAHTEFGQERSSSVSQPSQAQTQGQEQALTQTQEQVEAQAQAQAPTFSLMQFLNPDTTASIHLNDLETGALSSSRTPSCPQTLNYVRTNPVIDYRELCRQICEEDDQRASLFLQERLRYGISPEYEQIVAMINLHIEVLMVHKFGNFLVQCMLETASSDLSVSFGALISGRVAELSKNQFGCHVIQKLLDVAPVVIQARVTAELLDDIHATMTSQSGTHVWQKLLHLPQSPKLPPISLLVNNAIHLAKKEEGWVSLTESEAGCATIRCFLSTAQDDPNRKECVEELLGSFDTLMMRAHCASLICKLAVIGTIRARALTRLFSKAYEFCRHEIASQTIIRLFALKIPSFPARFSAAIAPYRTRLSSDKYGSAVLNALDAA